MGISGGHCGQYPASVASLLINRGTPQREVAGDLLIALLGASVTASRRRGRAGQPTVFLGRYSHNVDSKGRLAIPARFREALGEEIVITRGIDRCLSIYPMETWAPLAEKVSSLSISDPDARFFRRMVFAEAAYLEVDRQGRILLPGDLRQYAEIDREAVVVGVHSYIEVWSPRRWESQSQVMNEEGSSIAERLAEFI